MNRQKIFIICIVFMIGTGIIIALSWSSAPQPTTDKATASQATSTPVTVADNIMVEDESEFTAPAEESISVVPTLIPPTSTPIIRNPHELVITATPIPPQNLTISTPSADPIQDRVVIVFSPETSAQDRQAYLQSAGVTVIQTIDELGMVVVNQLPENLPSSITTTTLTDYYVTALATTANDPHYPEQWALRVLNVPQAWGFLPTTPATLTVAVIDSGVCYDHPDLAGQVLAGYDYVDDDTDPRDEYGHGCSVAGIISARADNATGIAGIAPYVQILPLRVLNEAGIGTYSDVAKAIVDATNQGADIINLSLGGVNPSPLLADAVAYAVSNGVTVVGAAGNNASPTVFYPAAYPDVIAVGSIDPNLSLSSFSNYGDGIDVFAPGRDIISTHIDGGYIYKSGTSFAAPHVSAMIALAKTLGLTIAFDGGVLTLELPDNPNPPTPPPPDPTEPPIINPNLTVYMRNPAAVYCTDLGYTYGQVEQDGVLVGLCTFPDGQQCEEWSFYGGTCGANYSYCAQNGYGIESRADGQDPFSAVYAVCLDENGAVLGSTSQLSTLSLHVVGCEDEACLSQRQANFPAPPPSTESDELDALALPSSYDWRNVDGQNWLTAIRNQGGCGSCWAFSTIGSVESVFKMTQGITTDLSEQHLVSDCCGAGSCSGGWPTSAMEFIQSSGVSTESCIPYIASNSACATQCNGGGSISPTLNYVSQVITGNSDNTSLKTNLINHGPLNVYLGISGSYGGYFDNNGVYRCTNDNQSGTNSGIDHAVVLVGYNDAGGYWIIRNSWGTGWPYGAWNDGGYFKLGYGECNTGVYGYSTVANPPVTPTITYPTNGATTGKQVTFQWNSNVPIRTGYSLIINQSSNPSATPQLVNTTLGKSTTSYTYTFTNTGTYYWHLRLNTSSLNSAWVTRSLNVDSSFCGQVTQIPVSECTALSSIFTQLGGSNWTNKSGWGQTTTPCSWYGVTCSGGHVTQISLSNNNLTGSLPTDINNLSYLQVFSVPFNHITGSIPTTYGSLPQLTNLGLSANQLTGSIPSQLGNLSQLQYLDLDRNQLTGSIPASLGNFANIIHFSLSWNNLSGTIPTELGNLTNASTYYLDGNDLTGSIPASFQNLHPAWLGLSYNQLSGAVPSWMGSEGYYYLNLSGNQFTSLPSTFSNLTSTRWLFLNDMNLGTFPSWLSGLTQLEFLELAGNNITGAIPTWMGNLTNLKGLNLSYNLLSGSLPSQLGNLTNLEYYLYLNNNQLSGSIPTWISNFYKLEDLNLSNNLFSGSIPSQIGTLTALTQLRLAYNRLTGEIPYNITYLVNTSVLNLRYNWLYAVNATTRSFLFARDSLWESTQNVVPSNNLVGNAISIGTAFPSVFTQNVYGASREAGDPSLTCASSGFSDTVWYRYTANQNSYITLDTTGSDYDTVIGVYSSAFAQLACDDDSAGNQLSRVSFTATSGTTYYIMVANWGSNSLTSDHILSLHTASDSNPPSVYFNVPKTGNAVTGNSVYLEVQASLDTNQVQFFVWYDPTFSGLGALETKPTIPAPPAPNSTDVSAQAAGWVYVGNGTNLGGGRWSYTWNASTVPDQWIGVYAYAFNSLGLYTGTQESSISLDRTAPTGSILSPAGSSIQANPLVLLQADAHDVTSGVASVQFYARSSLPFSNNQWVLLGTATYYPYVYDWDIQGLDDGTVELAIQITDNAGNTTGMMTGASRTFTINPPPANDLITSATVITPTEMYYGSQEVFGSTKSANDPSACASYVNSVWYTFNEPHEQEVSIGAYGGYDTILAVYRGTPNSLTLVGCNDNYNIWTQNSGLTFTAQPNQTYYVMVGNKGTVPLTGSTTLYLDVNSKYLVDNANELIAAIEYANQSVNFSMILLRPGNYNFSTPYAGGINALPTIVNSIAIYGNNQTIRRTGGAEYRLFEISQTGYLNISDLTIENGYLSGNDGGAILNRGTLQVYNSILRNNTAYWGGAITNWGNVNIWESSLIDNTAWNGGGALDHPGYHMTVNDSYLGGNTASWGGAIISWGDLTVVGSQLADNTVYYGGGAIRLYGKLWMFSSIVNNNSAGNWGGGISIYNATQATIQHTQFINNGSYYGGAIHNSLPIVTQALDEYPAGPDGEAVDAAYTDLAHIERHPYAELSAYSTPEMLMYANTFTNNHAHYGGAIYNYNAPVEINAATFNQNSAEREGGAVYSTMYSVMEFDQSTFSNNNALFSAGAIFNASYVSLINSTMNDNHANLYNGGAVVNYGELFVVNGSIHHNTSEDSGGGIFNAGSLNVQGTQFAHNSAYYNGGAILNGAGNSGAMIQNATFESNSTGYHGGAITTWGGNFNIINGTFINNQTAYEGGAIKLYANGDGAIYSISDSTFIGNSANYGGALNYHTDVPRTSIVTIWNSKFEGNISHINGGAISTGGLMSMEQSCVTNNTHTSVVNTSPNILTMTNNWWGLPQGPTIAQKFGDSISGLVNYVPFINSQPVGCNDVPVVDLEISVLPIDRAIAGQAVGLPLLVTNTSTDDAQEVIIKVTLPALLTPADLPATCSVAGDTISCNVGNIPANSSVPFTVVVRLDASLSVNPTLPIAVDSLTTDLILGNNQLDYLLEITAVSDLLINEQELFIGFKEALNTTPSDIESVVVNVTPTEVIFTVETATLGIGEVRMTVNNSVVGVTRLEISRVQADIAGNQSAFSTLMYQQFPTLFIYALEYGVYDIHRTLGDIVGMSLASDGVMVIVTED